MGLKALIDAFSELPSLMSGCFRPITAAALRAITFAKGGLRVGRFSYYGQDNFLAISQRQKHIKNYDSTHSLRELGASVGHWKYFQLQSVTSKCNGGHFICEL